MYYFDVMTFLSVLVEVINNCDFAAGEWPHKKMDFG
jgi:hypothetical protein